LPAPLHAAGNAYKAQNSEIVKAIPTSIAVFAWLLSTPAAALAQPGPVPAPRVPMPAPYYGLSGTFPLGAYSPQGPCAPGLCAYPVALNRAIRRELHQQELRRELEQRAENASRAVIQSPYIAPRYLPPATPESHLQPGYRGTGEIRPEFRTTGRPR